MRGRALGSTIALAALVVGVVTACSSVPDITFEDNPDAGGGRDALADGRCVASGPERCDDGIDNDCNGLADCADPACQPTHQCVDPAPAGWDLVAFAPDARPACPTGYGASSDVKSVLGSGAGTCSCACTPTTGSCTPISVTVSDAAGCGGTTSTASNIAPNASCTKLPTNVTVPNVNNPPSKLTFGAAPSACAGSVTLAGGSLAQGRACATPAAKGTGCQGSQVCVPKPTGFAGLCVSKTGATACPAGAYTQQRTAGTDLSNDGRGCGACTCETKPCAGTITLFGEADCTTGGAKKTSGPIGTTCAATEDKNYAATHYKTDGITNGCAIAAGGFNAAMTGSIAWDQERTVCCKP